MGFWCLKTVLYIIYIPLKVGIFLFIKGYFAGLYYLFSVVPLIKVLQLSISNYTHHDSYEFFWFCGVLSYPCFEGMTIL